MNKSIIHIHAPGGAVPKDGPSAGITIFSALYSCIMNFTISNQLAMTGELTLSGKVCEIGGLKEKLNSAIKSGITKVIIPKDNRLDNLDQDIINNIDIIQIDNINDIINLIQ